jgi:NADPH:quinone reductase-like Zn-dependent oxidoreductase
MERPAPAEGEVLVQVHAATVNRTDLGYLRAHPFFIRLVTGLFKPKRTVLGNEFAGEVVEVGESVTKFAVGDRVFGYDDEHMACHAEYKTIPETGVMTTIPDRLDYTDVVPGNEGVHYALANVKACDIQPGQSVLINGSTGAIGSSAVQLFKYHRAEVTAVCDTERIELVRSLGADHIIDYTKEDFTHTEQRFDVVFDAVGKSSFFACRHLITPGGIFVSTDLGPWVSNIWLPLLTRVFGSVGGVRAMFPLPHHSREVIEFLKGLITDGRLRPVIDRVYDIDDIQEAFGYVEQGEKTGNVVIRVCS